MAVAAERHLRIFPRGLPRPINADRDVLHIAGMVSLGTLQSMFLVIWIEVRSRRLEIWSIALCILVNVDGVLTRRQILRVNFDVHALLPSRRDRGRAHVRALAILQLDGSPLPFCLSRNRKDKYSTKTSSER